jgi:hypothetical protein
MTTGIWPTGTGSWAVVGPYFHELGKHGSAHFLDVPDGFVTDLASIPRAFHWLFNPYDPSTVEAAIVHDAMLEQGYEQRVAAGEFYRVMALSNLPVWKCRLFYLAVVFASTEA